MTTQQHDRTQQRSLRKPRRRQRQALAAHPAFAPLLGSWGTALAGLSVMVLPAPVIAPVIVPIIASISAGSGLQVSGFLMQLLIAGLAALLLGGALFLIAGQLARKARRSSATPSIVSLAMRHVNPIDPQRELGSASLDEPVKAMPFAAAAPEQPLVAEDEPPAAELPPPRALDLSEFAQLPGRNAVWVEDLPAPAEPGIAAPAPAPASIASIAAAEPAERGSPPIGPSSAALARLRALPPEELGLTQMVERFAGALHDHRAGMSGKDGTRREFAAREAALAEALKALSVLSGQSDTVPQGEPLRAALTKLQELRGAA